MYDKENVNGETEFRDQTSSDKTYEEIQMPSTTWNRWRGEQDYAPGMLKMRNSKLVILLQLHI